MIHKTDLTTKTVTLCNRGEIEGDGDALPLISGLSRLGSASDRESIVDQGGEIRFVDAIGAYGVERKLSDLLERYSLQDQDIEIEYAATEIGDLDPSGAFTDLYVGIVSSWRIDSDRKTPLLSIRFKGRTYNNRYLTKKTTAADFSTIATENLFKTIPVVIGDNIKVKPIMTTPVGDSSPEHVYAVTFGTAFPNGGVGAYYVKDYDNIYRQVQSAANVSTAVFENTDSATGSNTLNDGAGGANELCMFVDHDPTTDNFVVTQIGIEVGAAGSTTHQGTFTLRLWEAINNQNDVPPERVLAESVLDVSQFDTLLDATTLFFVVFPLNKAVVLAGTKDYWISLRHDGAGSGASHVTRMGGSALSGAKRFTKTTGGWNAGTTVGGVHARHKFYGCKFTDTATPNPQQVNSEGKGHSVFEVTQASSGYADRDVPDISALDFIVAISGLVDDGSGTITGTPSSRLNTTKEAIALLSREWNGSTWADSGKFDFSAYSDTHTVAETTTHTYYRTPNGATIGEVTFERWLTEICRNTACRPVLQRDGTIGIYYWGATLATSLVLTQENSKIVRVTTLDSSYVVNRVKFGYQRDLGQLNGARVLTEDNSGDYAKTIEWYSGAHATATSLIGDSETLYGKRTAATVNYDWISDQISAELLTRFLLSTYNAPPVYVDIEVPLSEISGIELMNVVEIKHPALPCFFGSSPNTQQPHYNGTEADVLNGFNLTRAKRYRAQIEGITTDFSEDMIPTATLTTRLLLNRKDPT